EELAELLGVESRATIYKDRQLLIKEHKIEFIEVERGRWKIDRSKYISNLRINLYETGMLYLMARKAARQTRFPNPHVTSLLESIAIMLNQPLMDRLLQSTGFIPKTDEQDGTTAVLEKIISCWVDQRKINIRYQGLKSQKPTVHLVSPYLLEPSLWNEGIYLVGYSETMDKIIPFKLNRILNAADTSQPIIFPQSFNESDFLNNVWSIWDGEGELVTVKLRFRGETAVKRVQESVWHPNQTEPELLPNGDLIWTTQVAEWREMLPWVRSWGADVEVLEPKDLREKLIQETLRLASIYDLNSAEKGYPIMDIFEQYLTLKGKTNPELTIFEHSSDVYHIALYLLEANKEIVQNRDLVKAGALLHDVGKIEQDIRQKQWVHQPHSSKYLQTLLDHPRLQMLLSENGIDMKNVQYDDLLLVCEHHHDIPTRPDLLRLNPDALLVSIADVLASSLEGGWLGDIREMLQSSPYTKLNTVLLRNLDLDAGLDGEIHRVDLPADSIPNALLADLIYRDMCIELRERGMVPLLQKHGLLWVKAKLDVLKDFLEKYTVNPRQLYQSAGIDDDVFESMLSSPAMPPAGVLEPSNMKFLLLNERIAQQLAASIVLRKTTKEVMEYFDISVSEVANIFQAQGIVDSLDEENDD
ncbi:MAG: WYL domain-containing protein, partial [Anaerolineae bacterium]|nr:WYL domain-containing protein [Anaerolineae bacterium]